MAHASHYTSIGAGRVTYWNEEYIKMLGGWIDVLSRKESLQQNCYNDGKSKIVNFIESWGYFYGYHLCGKYFEGYSDYSTYCADLSAYFPYFFQDVYDEIYVNNYISIGQIFEPYKFYSVKSVDAGV